MAPAPTLGYRMRVQLAGGAAFLGALAGAARLGWSLGLPWAVPADMPDPTAASMASGVVHALFALVAVLSVVALATGRPAGTRLGATAVAAWFATAATFAWGLWGLVNVLSASFLINASAGAVALNFQVLGQTFAGLVLGLVALAALTSRADTPR